MTGPVTLRADGLGVMIGGRRLLEGVSATFEPGRVHVIAGPNGAGKSTLLRALLGLVNPTEGRVTVTRGAALHPLAQLDAPDRARLMAAHLEAPNDSLGFTVTDVVALGRHGLHATGTTRSQAIDAALARFALGGLAHRPVGLLSAGERQRVSRARTFARETPALLLDEPASHLDVFHTARLVDHLREAAAAGRTVVAVLHDLDLIARLADDLTLLSRGQVVAHGRPETVLTSSAIRAVWGVEANLVTLGDGARLVHVRGVAR